MITLFTAILLISIIVLIVGLIKPNWVILWISKEQRNRKQVLKYFGLTAIGCLLLLSGLISNWIMSFTLLIILLGFAFLICLLVGVVNPMKIVTIGTKTRKKVLLQYGLLLVVSFIAFILVASIGMVKDEDDERIVLGHYEGQRVGNFRQGQGKLANNSTYYQGNWQSNKRDGKGTEYTNLGLIKTKYVGNWKNDKENGQGKMMRKVLWVKMTYEGEWKDGIREGQGKFITRAGDVYEGEWKDDAPNGKGKAILTNGEIYEGEFKDWKRNGYGKAVSKDGEILEGIWINDELQEESHS